MRADIAANLDRVLAGIAQACARAGRSAEDVTLVAVSKLQPVEKIAAFLSAAHERGLEPVLGENYVQEFAKKRPYLAPSYRCHLIGPLQRNKADAAVELFSLVESVHSIPLARALDRAAEKRGVKLPVFVQVNVSNDPGKHGIGRAELGAVVSRELPALSNLELRGLMTITRYYDRPEDARPDFRAMAELHAEATAALPPGAPRLALSMGMSRDFEIAIEEGATVVRVGTALFGER